MRRIHIGEIFFKLSFYFFHERGDGNIIDRIVNWIEEKKLFVRKRKSNVERALGMLLYHAGLSYNKASIFVNASYEAVRKWHRKRKKRKRIDEKEIRINGVRIYIWQQLI